jgi:uncharacterized protein (UPF0333 family)
MRRRDDSERGTASLELVGLMPVVAVVASLALQYAAVVFVAHAADDAARQAARAQSLGRDPTSAAEDVVPSNLDVEVVTSGSRVTVRVEVPRLSPLPQKTVTRSADMPDTTGLRP